MKYKYIIQSLKNLNYKHLDNKEYFVGHNI